MTFIEKIKARGYWSVAIHPETYAPDYDLPFEALDKAIRASVVNLRGWEFPHYDPNEVPRRMTDYIEQHIDWSVYLEVWRAYRSKQFVSLKAIEEDWSEQAVMPKPATNMEPGGSFAVEAAVFRLVEIFEFAARWTKALKLTGAIVVDVKLEKLGGRHLIVNGVRRVRFRIPRKSEAERWVWGAPRRAPIPVDELLSNTRELATMAAINLFELFHWDVRPETIRDIQGELRRL